MAFSRSVFTVLLLCAVCKASYVPVYLWGDLAAPNLKANPLTVTTTPAFSDILSEELADDPFTVIFIEKTLSIEDFSRRNADGKTSFPYLHENIRKSVYLPSVENAIDALTLLEDPKKVQIVTLTENGPAEIVPTTGKFLIVELEDAKEGESRAELLRSHNDFMKKTVTALRLEHPSVVAVYTARQPSWLISHSRHRRQASSNSSTSDLVLDGLRLYARNIALVDGANTVILQGYSGSSSTISATNMTTTLTFDNNSIALNFKEVAGYWFFDSVIVNPASTNEEFFPTEEVYALVGFSYRCGQNVSFIHSNTSRSLFFEDLKVQPFFQATNETQPPVFGDAFYCVGFFSAPIWSGLFVVFILLSITFFGIMMMLDIRTMDRFDDPKGKTITINAGD